MSTRKPASGKNSRRARRTSFVPRVHLAKLHAQFMCLPNTYATFIGAKQSGGRPTARPAVVCLVKGKLPDRELLPGRRIPRTITWRQGGRKRVVRTDVLGLTPDYVQESGVAGPGDALASGSVIATVGVAIQHPVHGDCVTTAGHFVEMAQSPGTVQLNLGNENVTATVRAVTMTASMDYAVLKPRAGVACDNLFADLMRVGPAYEPTFTDIGKQVFVLDRGNANRIPTICRGVQARVNLPEETLSDCILTDLVTQAGQSGTCLVDDQLRVWGLLRGRLSSQFSVFMPIHKLLKNEGVPRLLASQ